jgi:hypothetical protein
MAVFSLSARQRRAQKSRRKRLRKRFASDILQFHAKRRAYFVYRWRRNKHNVSSDRLRTLEGVCGVESNAAWPATALLIFIAVAMLVLTKLATVYHMPYMEDT